MSWLVKKQPGATKNAVTVGLFPQKQNDGDRQHPAGLEFAFGDHITVQPCNLAAVEGLSDKLPLWIRIEHQIRQEGPRSLATLAEELKAKTDSLLKAVNRNKKFTRTDAANGSSLVALAERRIA
jgi:hypothetical protein